MVLIYRDPRYGARWVIPAILVVGLFVVSVIILIASIEIIFSGNLKEMFYGHTKGMIIGSILAASWLFLLYIFIRGASYLFLSRKVLFSAFSCGSGVYLTPLIGRAVLMRSFSEVPLNSVSFPAR